MPTQNVNIKFGVNNVDLKTANDLLLKAKAATDQLQQSANKMGTSFNQGGAQMAKTLEGLNLRLQQLKGQINLTNSDNSAQLQKLVTEYKAVENEIQRVNTLIYGTGEATKAASIGFNQMFTAVRLFLTAGLAKELFDLTMNMASLAGKIEGVKLAFDKLPASGLLMQQLKAATHGMVDELTLMQKALQAQNFGIPLNKLATLLEFATTRAQQTGISVDYLVESIVTGLGRNSLKILDNLQINIGELKKRVQETGQTTQQVAIQMIGESLKTMDKYVETSETKVGRLRVAWTQFAQDFSNSAIWGKAIDLITKVSEGASAAINPNQFNQRTVDSKAKEDFDRFVRNNKDIVGTEKEVLAVERQLDVLRQRHLEQSIMIKQNEESLKNVPGDTRAERFSNADDIRKELNALKDRNTLFEAEIKLFEDYRKQLTLKTALETDDADAVEKAKKAEEEYENQLRVSKQAVQDYLELRKQLNEHLTQVKITGPTSSKGTFLGQEPDLINGGTKTPSPPNKNSSDAMNLKTWYNDYATFWDKVAMGFSDLGGRLQKGAEKDENWWRNHYRRMAQETVNAIATIITDQTNSIGQAELDQFDERIKNAQDFYDKQVELAGDNKNAVKHIKMQEKIEMDRLEKERAEKAKKIRLSGIIVDTAANVVKSILENGGVPYGLPFGAIAAALGASQYAIANRAKYAKGVINLQGPGTETSDSIDASLSKGESVMTARETRENMGILKAIRAKKINDKILDEIVSKNGGSQAQVFDDTRLIKAIEKNKPDLIKIGSMVYEAKKTGDYSRKLVRNKYLSQ